MQVCRSGQLSTMPKPTHANRNGRPGRRQVQRQLSNNTMGFAITNVGTGCNLSQHHSQILVSLHPKACVVQGDIMQSTVRKRSLQARRF